MVGETEEVIVLLAFLWESAKDISLKQNNKQANNNSSGDFAAGI